MLVLWLASGLLAKASESPPVEQSVGGGLAAVRKPKRRVLVSIVDDEDDAPISPPKAKIKADVAETISAPALASPLLGFETTQVSPPQPVNTQLADQLAVIRERIALNKAMIAAQDDLDDEDEEFALMMMIALAA